MNENTDKIEQIVLQIQKGCNNPQKLKLELYQRLEGDIRRIAHKRPQPIRGSAEDLIQEAYLYMEHCLETYEKRERGSFRSYFHQWFRQESMLIALSHNYPLKLPINDYKKREIVGFTGNVDELLSEEPKGDNLDEAAKIMEEYTDRKTVIAFFLLNGINCEKHTLNEVSEEMNISVWSLRNKIEKAVKKWSKNDKLKEVIVNAL